MVALTARSLVERRMGWSIIVSTAGTYTAVTGNIFNFCGDSPPSNAVIVTIHPPFMPTVQVSNICELTAQSGATTNGSWMALKYLAPPGKTGPQQFRAFIPCL
jgi:hypothetical protein